MVKKRLLAMLGGVTVVLLGAMVIWSVQPASAKPTVTVYKNATCGCCRGWIEHLRKEGYEVIAEDVDNLAAIKAELGVRSSFSSCHTALVDGYIVEGHVPAADIDRLLAERPEIAGLSAPGMPASSPGMAIPGRPVDPFDVLAFDELGKTTVYAKH
ncbi:MAG: DUF411 domain-containing protein [Gemmatimonadota bacterium]|nr:MAG: DUF411 domain-containing protein [Gemmatimonadota bacterium]